MVFESLSTNEFGYFVAPKDTNFSNVHSLTTPALEKCFHSSSDFNLTWDEAVSGIESKNYDRLDFDACSSFVSPHMGIKAVVMLADNLTVSDGGNASVLAVNSPIVNNSVFAGRFAFESAGVGPSIQCMDEMILHMEVDDRLTNFIGYNYNYTVNECLVLKARGHCQLLYSPPICIAIALTAFVKVSAMFLAARVGRNRSPPLLTVGDAISSFISRPDLTTKDLCWLSSKHVRKGTWAGTRGENSPTIYNSLSKPQFWLRAVSRWRWVITLLS